MGMFYGVHESTPVSVSVSLLRFSNSCLPHEGCRTRNGGAQYRYADEYTSTGVQVQLLLPSLLS